MRDQAKFCSVAGCGRLKVARGMCDPHYRRLRRSGDPLGGRVPPGSIPTYLNEVVLAYDGDECLLWPYNRTPGGYAIMRAAGRTQLVSRFVCEKEHGPPPTATHQAAHSCGRGHLGCVTKRHLLWKTPKQNADDRKVHGTATSGETHSRAKLSELQVREILASKGAISAGKVAAKFGVTASNIRRIYAGKTWRALDAR